LEVVRLEAGSLGDLREYRGAEFLVAMEESG
jgi:hypothetical protein